MRNLWGKHIHVCYANYVTFIYILSEINSICFTVTDARKMGKIIESKELSVQ